MFGYLLPALLLSQAFGAYFVFRYLGFWTEQDTAVFARIITDMKDFGSLTSPGAYTHGYAYPIWAATLSDMTGLSVADLLQLYTPLIGTLLLGIFSFATFRRLLASERLGLLATSLVFMVPELVFTVSRGNHEKLTVSLTLLAMLALMNSYLEMYQKNRWPVFAAWVGVLYVTNFTLISLNSFFGSGFTVASSLLLVFSALIRFIKFRQGRKLAPVVRRLVIIVGINWLLITLVLSYVYPSSSRNFQFVSSAQERIVELFRGAPEGEAGEAEEPSFVASDPYQVRETDWANVRAYQVLSSFRWLLFLGSFITALGLVIRVFRRLDTMLLQHLFLLAFYGAYAFILALAIPIDFLNLSAGTNLQVRMYTYFSVTAAPLLALGIASLLETLRPKKLKTAAIVVTATLLSGFTLISMAKSTLDPTVSNRWLFYHPAEIQAMRFWDTKIWDVRDQPGPLWIEVQGRLLFAYRTLYPNEPQRLNNFQMIHDIDTAHAMASPLFRESTVSWGRRTPPFWLNERTYDNGHVQIYHREPRTPLQR